MSDPPLSVRFEQERAARVEAELERDRLAFLASASTALTSGLDPLGTVSTLASLLVPALCTWCIVHTVGDDGRLTQRATAHATEAGVALIERAVALRDLVGGTAGWAASEVADSGRARTFEPVTAADLEAEAVSAEHLAALQELAPGTVVTLPLFARGRVVGVLTCARSGASGGFGAHDQLLIENVAARAGMALDNARLFAERTQVARILQHALLPPSLPEIPGIEVSARYRTAEEQLDIGGDFYDVFELGDGSWSVVIGDVSGKGSVAAAITGLVRNTIRAVSQAGAPPSEVLRRANDVLLGQVDDTRFCTAALMHLVTDGSGARVRLASGGHPRPFLMRLSGEVQPIDGTGTLLGVVPDPHMEDTDLELGRGDAVVLYTDGVTEARRGDEEFGEAGIAQVLRGCVGHSAGTIADHLARAVHAYADRGGDDTAVLVVRKSPL